MKAVILCAGLGTRLKPLSDKIPKPMLKVLNIPMIEYTINYLAENGVKTFFVNLYHLPHVFKNLKIPKNVTVDFYHEKEIQGSLGGLLSFKNKLKDDDFLLVNGDMLFEFDLKSYIKKHKESKFIATLLLRKKESPEFNSVFADNFGNVVHIGKEFDKKDMYRELMFSGIHIINPEFFSKLEKKYKAPSNIVHDFYEPFLASGGKLGAYVMKDTDIWMDIGDVNSYLDTNMRLFKLLTDKINVDYYSSFISTYWSKVEDGVEEIVEDIWISRSSYVDPNATIFSPVFIGKNCRLERGVKLGPNTILGDNVIVGPNAEVANSLVFDDINVEMDQKIDKQILFTK